MPRALNDFFGQPRKTRPREGVVSHTRAPRVPPDVPCVHRSPAAVRSESCRTCSNHYGLSQIEVFHCALLDCDCTRVRSEVMDARRLNARGRPQLAAWCETCRHRQPPAASVVERP
jgi:hypothetical protein